MNYDHTKVEKKWQRIWESEKLYSPQFGKTFKKQKFYNLMMFPYPSAEGLHVGNMYAFTGADVYGRFKRMMEYEVFEPIGLDGFGIHSENYAIKVGRHPKEHAKISEKNFYKQLHMIGNSYDWSKTLETYDPAYYKWTQWLFVKMFKAGLAYKKMTQVNWCPSCKTVLADEQVVNGKCERCVSEVVKREMSSWFFKITNYADRLLKNIEKINWPEKIKIAQRNWIGRSEGRLIRFKNYDLRFKNDYLEVFTTRPETVNSVTFLAKAGEVDKFTGEYAINPSNGEKIPVWEAEYVLADYGTGMIMGVPAYDDRDREFAKKHGIKVVKNKFTERILGEKKVNYHLRDWGISRQRYWGPPIPMINCKDCGWQPVPENELPILLPDVKDFKPHGDGVSPLHNAPDTWKKVKCPNCGSLAKRELDVSDTFLDSSWYFLAYPNLGSSEWRGYESPFNKKITKNWLPVDAYIGGAEHAVLHLLYARFVWMVLRDLGYLDFPASNASRSDAGWEEPFPHLFGHGLIIKDGAKMSKSKGNVVNPDEYINKYGADTMRCYLMFLGPYNQGGDFRDSGIEGMNRFLKKVWRLFTESKLQMTNDKLQIYKSNYELHKTIKGVTEDIKLFKYNTAIAKIMELVNVMYDNLSQISDSDLKSLTQLLAPFAPHMTEEIWRGILKQKGSVHTSSWPKYDEKYLKVDKVIMVVQVNGKVRTTLNVEYGISNIEKEVIKLAKEDQKISEWLKDKQIKKEIFIEGKLINFVI